MNKEELLEIIIDKLESNAMKRGLAFDEGVSISCKLVGSNEKKLFEDNIDFFEERIELYTGCEVSWEIEYEEVYIAVQ